MMIPCISISSLHCMRQRIIICRASFSGVPCAEIRHTATALKTFGKCAFSYAGPAAWNPLHGVEPTSCRHPVYNRLSHRHLKSCSNLILVANTFCSTVYLYVVRRLCSASNRRPTKSMMMMNDDDKPGGRLSYFPPGPRLPPSRRASPIGWYRLYLSRCIIISYRSYKVQHCCVRS